MPRNLLFLTLLFSWPVLAIADEPPREAGKQHAGQAADANDDKPAPARPDRGPAAADETSADQANNGEVANEKADPRDDDARSAQKGRAADRRPSSATEVYRKLRELNREARRREQIRVRRPPPVLPVIRHERLTVAQLNPKTGEIYWHELLKQDRYAAEREEIEAAFRDWARRKTLDSEAVGQAARQMLAKLNEEVRRVRPRDYIAARNFIERIIHTAHFTDS